MCQDYVLLSGYYLLYLVNDSHGQTMPDREQHKILNFVHFVFCIQDKFCTMYLP